MWHALSPNICTVLSYFPRVCRIRTGKVNGQWRSMIAFFEMAGYAAAVYVPGNIAVEEEGSLCALIVGERINFVSRGSRP
jgi:hypothetical protein